MNTLFVNIVRVSPKHAPLLVIDEAAAVRVPDLRAVLACPAASLLMISTLSGCEGTGGALAWKVLGLGSESREGHADSTGTCMGDVFSGALCLSLQEPLRYGSGCPLEQVFDRLLFFGAGVDLPLHELDCTTLDHVQDAPLPYTGKTSPKGALGAGCLPPMLSSLPGGGVLLPFVVVMWGGGGTRPSVRHHDDSSRFTKMNHHDESWGFIIMSLMILHEPS